MNHALRMDHDADRVGRQIEQPVRFDNLEPLVHEGGRIDRDLRAHPPRRMIERILDRDRAETFSRPLAERTARGGQDDALERRARLSLKALEDAFLLPLYRRPLD